MACRGRFLATSSRGRLREREGGKGGKGKGKKAFCFRVPFAVAETGPGGDVERHLDKQICSSGERGRQRRLTWSRQDGNGI